MPGRMRNRRGFSLFSRMSRKELTFWVNKEYGAICYTSYPNGCRDCAYFKFLNRQEGLEGDIMDNACCGGLDQTYFEQFKSLCQAKLNELRRNRT